MSDLNQGYLRLFRTELQRNPVCRCSEGDDCWYFPSYTWCRACEEHHRRECVINELGQGLDPDGNPVAGADLTIPPTGGQTRGMNRAAARTGLITLAVLVSVVNGSPLAVPVSGLAALILYRLVDYGAREVERALELASQERVAQLAWELRTAAAQLALRERRCPAAPAWPTTDPDAFLAELETMLIPTQRAAEVPVLDRRDWVTTRGDEVDTFEFADGGLLCVPAALRLFRYAGAS